MESRENTKRDEETISFIKTEKGEISGNQMLGGVEYLINVMDVHRDKLLYYLVIHCWIVLLYFLISLVFSFIITLLINVLPKFVLWTIVVLCLIVLTTECVNSFVKYKELSTNQGEVFLPTFIINTYSYWWNKNTWLVCSIILGSITVFILLLLLASSFSTTPIKATINNIEEASRVAGWKILILIPILQSIRQGFLLFMLVLVATNLATTGYQVHKVMDACSSETCIDEATNKTFRDSVTCIPGKFSDNTTRCPISKCTYNKFQTSWWIFLLQVCNLVAVCWLLFCVQAVKSLTLAGVVTSVGTVFESVKNTWRYHLGTVELS